MQHDVPRLVPLQSSEGGEADRLAVVFPNVGTAIVVHLGGSGACQSVEIPSAPLMNAESVLGSGGFGGGGGGGGGGGIMSTILSSRSSSSSSSSSTSSSSSSLRHVIPLPGGGMALFGEGDSTLTLLDMNATSTEQVGVEGAGGGGVGRRPPARQRWVSSRRR